MLKYLISMAISHLQRRDLGLLFQLSQQQGEILIRRNNYIICTFLLHLP